MQGRRKSMRRGRHATCLVRQQGRRTCSLLRADLREAWVERLYMAPPMQRPAEPVRSHVIIRDQANGLAAGSVTIASVHAARDALRSGWRPSASRAAGRASSDDAGPRTPALLLRQERGHQARTDSGSLRTKRSSAYRGSDEMTAAPWSSSSRVIEIAASVGTAVPRHKLDSA